VSPSLVSANPVALLCRSIIQQVSDSDNDSFEKKVKEERKKLKNKN